MAGIAELEVGDWITPRKLGSLWRVEKFLPGHDVLLARYPLNEHNTMTRSFETLSKNWRHAYSNDWKREQSVTPPPSEDTR